MLTCSGALKIHSNKTIYFLPLIQDYFGGSKNLCYLLQLFYLHLDHFIPVTPSPSHTGGTKTNLLASIQGLGKVQRQILVLRVHSRIVII